MLIWLLIYRIEYAAVQVRAAFYDEFFITTVQYEYETGTRTILVLVQNSMDTVVLTVNTLPFPCA
jgi:hypothetical protein